MVKLFYSILGFFFFFLGFVFIFQAAIGITGLAIVEDVDNPISSLLGIAFFFVGIALLKKSRDRRKGQAAMEFLMTYGWAILAAIIVIAILASIGFLRFGDQAVGILAPPFYLQAFSMEYDSDSGTPGVQSAVKVEIKNQGGSPVTVTGVEVEGTSQGDAVSCTATFSGVLDAGSLEVIVAECDQTLEQGGSFKGTVTVTYTKQGSQLALTSLGEVSGPIVAGTDAQQQGGGETCGNEIVEIGEECDGGSQACTTGGYAGTETCQPDCTYGACVATESCGDNVVQAGAGEDCDDGNGNNNDACLSTCTDALCGDGYVWTGTETCDDGGVSNGDGCSSTCTVEHYKVFITSTTSTGNLGGLNGADTTCDNLATAANLTGTGNWRAWLSTNVTNASSRLYHSAVPYKLINGTTVASSWTDLTDASISAGIILTETGTPTGVASVWTGTTGSGGSSGNNCNSWINSTTYTGTQGGATFLSLSQWTIRGSAACNSLFRMYCFEQP